MGATRQETWCYLFAFERANIKGHYVEKQKDLSTLLLQCSSVICLSWLYLCLCFFLFFVALVDARTNHHRDHDAEGALRDVRASIQFKKCITNDPLSLLKNWNASAPASAPNACNWTGISCSTKHPGRVVQICLESATLYGCLSPHVSNLSFLQVLDIYNNSLSGTIPSSLGKLHRLRVLDLCSNEFEGVIPYQLGNLSSLQLLFLCSNSLSGEIPGSLARLQEVKQLNVFQNQLDGQVPSWVGALRQLEWLVLGENNIGGVIPAELGNLSSSLTYLDLEANYLQGFIPCSLGSLHRLTDLYLYQNNLTGTIPSCLHNLSALEQLDLDSNNLEGPLPSWIGRSFNNLQWLSLFLNGFTSNIPESWRNLTKLQVLDLSQNKLSGTPPSWLGTLCIRLKTLSIASNHFNSGVSMPRQPIPILVALSNCSSLDRLDIHDNFLRGTLPPKFGGSLPNLQYLSLSENFITGNISPGIGNLSSLARLDLGHNILGGTIPSQIANLRSMEGIDLRQNKLQGNIPTEIFLLNKSLGYLYLSENMLSGSIPANIGNLINLRKLHLDGNLLSGKIPSEIGHCPVLEDLVLSANNLSGPIPPEVAGVKSIVFNFDLSANYLTGEVPPEIAGLQMAQYINLSGNQLSGNIASYMDSWLDAREINMSSNNFTGNLSKSIGNKLVELQSIDLSGNNFTGPVPASLFNHSALQFLNFSCNNFDAEVPCLHNSIKKLRLTRWSFIGNPNLCGRCFGLKACLVSPEKRTFHFNKDNILKIVLCILGLLLLLVIAGILFMFRRIETSKGESPRISEKFLQISAEEVQRATDNFSPSNLVGEGSHGKVYKGILSSGMVIAVKCFSSADQHGTVKSFEKECHALGKVRHRNILKIIAMVWSDELKALIMPFMSNSNLHSLLYNREDGQLTSLTLATRVKVLTELARGLGYLHHDCDFQVIHCDIKPENVLLDEDMTVKISDFGISHLTESLDGATTSSSLSLKGSVGYIAPEYGIGERIWIKGDVYSFGVVVLEVMTRLRPTHEMFSGDLTLPLWISMALQGKCVEERIQILKDILKMADEGGGGIDIDNNEEISAVDAILIIGLRCTCQNASMGPNMKEVESCLQSIGNLQNQVMLQRNLEDIIKIVESQPPLLHKRVKAETSMFSSD